jgi:hypothetical protein
MITLKLCLEESGLRAEVELVDTTYEKLQRRVKHTLDVMYNAMEFQRRYQNAGATIELENRKEIALVCQGAGSNDAGPDGEREGNLKPSPGL